MNKPYDIMAKGLLEGALAGLREGLREGLAPLVRQYQRNLGRDLTEAERETLLARLTTVGADRLGDLVLDLDGPALDRWLRDSAAP